MARICRHRGEVARAFALLASPFLAPAFAEDQGPNVGTDLYDRPVLAIDPGMQRLRFGPKPSTRRASSL